MIERMVCIQIKYLDISAGTKFSIRGVDNPEAVIEVKSVDADGKYSSFIDEGGTRDEMILRVRKWKDTFASHSVSIGEVYEKRLKDLKDGKASRRPRKLN
jgi:hypothetical protein